jgi:hypothetical protein
LSHPLSLQRVQKISKMSKTSSASRGVRTTTTGITDRMLPRERGCRGTCPDTGGLLLQEANRSLN